MPTMSLKSLVRAATAGVAVGCVLVIAATAGAYYKLTAIHTQASYATSVGESVTTLNLLTSQLMLRQSERVMLQLKVQQARLSGQLANPPRLGNRADSLVMELARGAGTMTVLLDQLGASLALPGGIAAMTKEARDSLFASLIAQSGKLQSRSLAIQAITAEEISSLQQIALTTIGCGFLACMVGGALLLLLVSHRLLTPILKLRAIIQEIGGGNLSADIPTLRRDEIGDVFRELHQMRLGLLQSIGEVGRVNLQLITAKADLEDRVAERTASLEMANRDLESFLYAVSHDLRAPLRSMSGFSQAVLETYGPKLDEEGRSMLRRVERATRQMRQLIDDLLKISRIDATAAIGTVNLSGIAGDIATTLRERTPDCQVQISIEPDICGQCDGPLMAIALTNLFENAWKFTSRTTNAHIEFGQEQDGGRCTYFVRDNGAGFDMAHCDKLFKPFQRLHTNEQFPGTGIGLATVARIIRAHGGKIWGTSEPGKGAKFSFQFGIATGRAASDRAADEHQPGATSGDQVAQRLRAS